MKIKNNYLTKQAKYDACHCTDGNFKAYLPTKVLRFLSDKSHTLVSYLYIINFYFISLSGFIIF